MADLLDASQFAPKFRLQGETCCCFIDMRAGILMICALTVIGSLSQFGYEKDHGKDMWWLWMYMITCSLFALIGVSAVITYRKFLAKLYCIWLVISCVIWVIDSIIYADDALGYALTFSVLAVKIYFVYIVWKYHKILSTQYAPLRMES